MEIKQGGDPPLGVKRQIEVTSLQDLKAYIDREIINLKAYVQDKFDQLQSNITTVAETLSRVVCRTDKQLEQLALDTEAKFKDFDLKLHDVDVKMRNMDNGITKAHLKPMESAIDTEAKLKELDLKFQNADVKMHNMDNEIIKTRLKGMESAIRLRGLNEYLQEDIKRTSANVLAPLMKVDPDEVFSKIARAYRVNTRAALLRQLPRDVVIYFTDINFRNDIVRKSFYSAVQMDGTQIKIFKELPAVILKYRRDFGFLARELKKRQIQYRWDVPMGIIFWFQGVRYRFNALDEAKRFYDTVLKINSTSLPTNLSTDNETDIQMQSDKDVEEQITQMPKKKIQGAVGGFQVDSFESSTLILGGSSKTKLNTTSLSTDDQQARRDITKPMQATSKQWKPQTRCVKKTKGKK